MHRTQIYLTNNEREQLHLIAEETERYQSALIREAIDQYIEGYILRGIEILRFPQRQSLGVRS